MSAEERAMCACGQFFGSPETDNMCSGCFREFKKQGGVSAARSHAVSPSPVMAAAAAVVAAAQESIEEAAAVPLAGKSTAALPSTGAASSSSAAGVPAVDSGLTEAASAGDRPRRVQKRKNRCFACHLKLSLVQQSTNLCRCGYTFCDKHRHAEQHDCIFDHKTHGRSTIAKALPGQHQRAGLGVHRLDSTGS